MSESERPQRDPYDIEPEPRAPEPAPEGRPPPGTPHIDAEGLLEGFDEDADLTADPEVEEALHGRKPEKIDRTAEAEALAHPERFLVQPGFPDAKVSLIAGGVLLVLAVILTAVRLQEREILGSLHWAYEIVLHTGSGLVAALAAAQALGRRLNSPELAFARMSVPVAGAYLVWTLRLPLEGLVEETLLAMLIYVLLLWTVFRLPRYETAVLAGCHFLIWLVLQIGNELAAAASG